MGRGSRPPRPDLDALVAAYREVLARADATMAAQDAVIVDLRATVEIQDAAISAALDAAAGWPPACD